MDSPLELDGIHKKRPETGRSFFRRSVPEMGRVSSPHLRFAHKFGQLADKVYMPADLCLLNMTQKVAETRNSRARQSSFVGRLGNRIMGHRLDSVELSGAVIAGVKNYVGDRVPDGFDRGQDYLMKFEVAENLLTRMREKAKAEGMIK